MKQVTIIFRYFPNDSNKKNLIKKDYLSRIKCNNKQIEKNITTAFDIKLKK